MGISGAADIERALTPLHQITQALPLTLFAIVILKVSGRQLGLRLQES
jgi:hypothetical protein